jgi:hypothetical protein
MVMNGDTFVVSQWGVNGRVTNANKPSVIRARSLLHHNNMRDTG